MEAGREHPFFTLSHGWSSASPERSMSKYQLSCHQLKVGDVCISLSHYKSEAATPAVASTEMRPPPPPNEMQLERRRSNSASPSDKLLLKRTASVTSPLASTRPSNFYSPTKQVIFSAEAENIPMKKRKIHHHEATSTVTSEVTQEQTMKNAHSIYK